MIRKLAVKAYSKIHPKIRLERTNVKNSQQSGRLLELGATRMQELYVRAARSTLSTLDIHLGIHAD